jgi:hypothetical protein
MRNRAFRRHQIDRHMNRRLSEDRNQHYDRLDCPCWTDARIMSRFKEQPKTQQCYCCCNIRRNDWLKKEKLTMQERRFTQDKGED